MKYGFLFSTVPALPVRKEFNVPGIDFKQIRRVVRIKQILDRLDFKMTSRSRSVVRGLCPIHGSTNPKSRSFAADLARDCYCCHSCGANGNQLDLWMAVKEMTIYDAAIDLCETMGIEPPSIQRW